MFRQWKTHVKSVIYFDGIGSLTNMNRAAFKSKQYSTNRQFLPWRPSCNGNFPALQEATIKMKNMTNTAFILVTVLIFRSLLQGISLFPLFENSKQYIDHNRIMSSASSRLLEMNCTIGFALLNTYFMGDKTNNCFLF